VIVRNRVYGRGMTDNIAGLLGVSGYALVAVLCGLIALEELGIPMPFAPGDFLLVLVGMSIATAHVNPLVVIAVTYASALLGAVGGRELFERIGIVALPRVAALIHAGGRVDEMSARLRRRGSTGVFLGRITPGLRVVTTYVCGLVRMPRRTFVAGLAPGVAVYQGVFIGLGAWLGPTAWVTIEHYAPKPGQLVLLFAVIGGSMIAGHALVNRNRGPKPA
jgi:membrane protein DedA with SNARE-associated domain